MQKNMNHAKKHEFHGINTRLLENNTRGNFRLPWGTKISWRIPKPKAHYTDRKIGVLHTSIKQHANALDQLSWTNTLFSENKFENYFKIK